MAGGTVVLWGLVGTMGTWAFALRQGNQRRAGDRKVPEPDLFGNGSEEEGGVVCVRSVKCREEQQVRDEPRGQPVATVTVQETEDRDSNWGIVAEVASPAPPLKRLL